MAKRVINNYSLETAKTFSTFKSEEAKETNLYNASLVNISYEAHEAELAEVKLNKAGLDMGTRIQKQFSIVDVMNEEKAIIDFVIEAYGLEKDYFSKYNKRIENKSWDIPLEMYDGERVIPMEFGSVLKENLHKIKTADMFTEIVKECAIEDIKKYGKNGIPSNIATRIYDRIIADNENVLPTDLFDVLHNGNDYRFEIFVYNIFSSHKELFDVPYIRVSRENKSRGAYIYTSVA